MRRRFQYSFGPLFLFTVACAVLATCYRYHEIRRAKLLSTIVDAGGSVETRKSVFPLLHGSVKVVQLPGSSLDQVQIQDLERFPWLEKVRVEKYLYSGTSTSDPSAVIGSFELEGGLPESWDVAHQMMSRLMKQNAAKLAAGKYGDQSASPAE